jgi:hypothetical protein
LGPAHLPGFVQEGAVIDLRPCDLARDVRSQKSAIHIPRALRRLLGEFDAARGNSGSFMSADQPDQRPRPYAVRIPDRQTGRRASRYVRDRRCRPAPQLALGVGQNGHTAAFIRVNVIIKLGNHAFVFYDRADQIFMQDVDVFDLTGRALYSGVLRRTTQSFMRNRISTACGSSGVGPPTPPWLISTHRAMATVPTKSASTGWTSLLPLESGCSFTAAAAKKGTG